MRNIYIQEEDASTEICESRGVNEENKDEKTQIGMEIKKNMKMECCIDIVNKNKIDKKKIFYTFKGAMELIIDSVIGEML